MNQNIENYLPHRAPFLFVDKITLVSKETVEGVKTFGDADSLFQGNNKEFTFVPQGILLESMIQCGSAGIRMNEDVNGTFALTTIEDAEFYDSVKFDQPINYVIKNLKINSKLIKQSGKAYMYDKLIMKANWMSVKMDK